MNPTPPDTDTNIDTDYTSLGYFNIMLILHLSDPNIFLSRRNYIGERTTLGFLDLGIPTT